MTTTTELRTTTTPALSLLTAMSLLAFLGLRYPVKMLPVLLFESLWKLLWLGLVALPNAAAGTLLVSRP